MPELNERIITVNVNEHMMSSYIDYSMSVIVSRALPDVRDGLKPVHRRVLFGMSELGLWSNKPHKKSARIVGEVLGKYHPHGDTSVYDAMVRMAQPWSMRHTLVDGQGNFGSIDGDSPAAMRYTEARLAKIAEELLADLDKNTVDFKPNFDESLEEPVVLPSGIPNLLVNGSSGIAVGMATNIPPHNLSEVIDGIIQYIDNKDITIDELMQFIKAPDFPTGGIIYGYDGVHNAFKTGRGRIVIRSKAEIIAEDNQIIVTEIPYQVNKAVMIMKTADLVNDKVIEGLSDIRDESDRDGMRIVYELKRDANAQVVLNNLFKHTQLQSVYNVNTIALVKNRPMNLNLKDIIRHYVDHRHEVVIRRTNYELNEAKKRAHILEGLLIALDHLDEVISLIRESTTPDLAREGLINKFGLSEEQARAILEMRLRTLTGLERDKIKSEYNELQLKISELEAILADESKRMEIIKKELTEIKNKYGEPRRTEIVLCADDINIKDIIPNDDVVITISHNGYLKRTLLSDYRIQKRGGKGSKGATSRDDDYLEYIFVSKAHNYMLLFTDKGKCYWLNVYEIPEGEKGTKGRAIQNLIALDQGENIRAFLSIYDLEDKEYTQNHFIVFVTKKGMIKKTVLDAYSRPRQGGIIAININEGDALMNALLTDGKSDIILGSKYGQAIRFNEAKVRAMGRNATGVKGIKLSTKHQDDEVVDMLTVNDLDATIMVVTEKGFGKRTPLDDYRITNRGGKGIRTLNTTNKTGKLIAIGKVKDGEEIMIINKSGITIRLAISNIRVMGRATQGVRLIKLNEGDEISSITGIAIVDDEISDENTIEENGFDENDQLKNEIEDFDDQKDE